MLKTEILLRLSSYDVLVVRKKALERLAAEETRCDRLDGRVVEVVIQEYLNWLNGDMCSHSIRANGEPAAALSGAEPADDEKGVKR